MTYTPPIRRINTARSHHYQDATGTRIPGVTTIIGDGIPKPALVNWAANATAEYAVDNWNTLGDLSPSARLKELTGARYAVKDAAANRGTQVHAIAERLVAGETVDVPAELVGYAESYARFLDDFSVEPVHVEFSCYSIRHGYAGTGDLIAWLETPELGRHLALCDVKTNRSGIFAETGLQLAGYRYAETIIDTVDSDVHYPMPEVHACYGIHVTPNTASLVPVTAGPEQHRVLLYAAEVARWSRISRDLVGPPVTPPGESRYRLVREDQ